MGAKLRPYNMQGTGNKGGFMQKENSANALWKDIVDRNYHDTETTYFIYAFPLDKLKDT